MTTLSAAWLLHSRPYKERSVIAEYLVKDHGRVAMVVQGVRKTRSRSAHLIQPFTSSLVSWRGRGELKSQTSSELSRSVQLTGKALYCGFYLNELMLRAVLPGQQLDGLFELYEWILDKLSQASQLEPVLRLFELELLEVTGYLPDLGHSAADGVPLAADCFYRFSPNRGLLPVYKNAATESCFSGALLLALANRDFSQPEYFQGYKQFTRRALLPLVGNKPFKSRELFRASSKEKSAS
ncbi:DNA repair protein RecO [Endozoicomonas sp. OPT23]|uniref:DNA repair protein RecO n=1 Tax=Endozoicomonas sp. OPT23 TaxID=2072845 RepID=UPI00129AC926|nr:DNA repair protein RecO [Endozoicomonas sp. OPT23]MRI34870.1 DNA repair protein RecO [Endozoicomonas sp. OPT23]